MATTTVGFPEFPRPSLHFGAPLALGGSQGHSPPPAPPGDARSVATEGSLLPGLKCVRQARRRRVRDPLPAAADMMGEHPPPNAPGNPFDWFREAMSAVGRMADRFNARPELDAAGTSG